MRVVRFVQAFAMALLMVSAGFRADSAWTIPGIVSAAGLNNTRFVSDLTVTNPGATPAQVTISFFPSASANPKSVTLSPGETIAYRNVVETLFGTTGAGALSITSDQPLLLRARTYNTAPTGTYGVALPVYADDRLLATGETGDSLWISQDASGTSGYRTNIAVVFPDETGGAATVTVYDADGNERGHKDYGLDTAGFQQFAVGSFAGTVSVGRAQIHITRGHAAGYSVVVDNVTGDSSLFTFEDLPGGRQDVLLNGVARANGRNGTFFRTDGRFYNQTDTEATVTVAFHANGDSNPSPVTASFTLPAGRIRDVVDVLDALLGLPVGSSGALRFTSDWPVAILCRTSNVDPTGARPGSFGAQQKPVQVLSFLTSADEGASITGIRQDASYRTNVGFAAGEDGARYTLTLTTAAGTTVASTSTSLGPRGWKQPNVQDLFPGISIPPDATLRIRVTEGSLDAFDSSIDNASGDSVVTPIAPLPAAIPSSATIGPAGGSIRSSDGRLTLKIPAGALSQPASFSLQETTNDAPQGTGPGYQLAPSGITFARPALLTLAYGREETDGASAEALIIASRAAAGWYILAGGTVDPVHHTLTVPLGSTSPASARSSPGRDILADGTTQLAVTKSWVMMPSGKQAVLTNGRLPFTLYSVADGGSSSTLVDFVDQLTGTILKNPDAVKAAWYVNGVLDGLTGFGIILHEGTATSLSVQYLAPECPPQTNPVAIQASVKNKRGKFSTWYSVSTNAWVYVLPPKWVAKGTYVIDQQCKGSEEFLDHLVFKGDVAFTLNDKLKVTGGSFTEGERELGTASGCSGCDCSDLKRTTVPDFHMSVVTGSYDPENETFDMTLSVTLPVRAGYSYMWGDPKRPGSSEPGVISNVLNKTLQQGLNPDVFKASYLLALSIEIKQDDCGLGP